MPDIDIFQADFTTGLSNLSDLQKLIGLEGSSKKGLFVNDKCVKAKYVPFVVRVLTVSLLARRPVSCYH